MLKMSFYNGTLDKNELKSFVLATSKPIVYTYGLGMRNPTTYRKPVSVDEAIQIVDAQSLLDATEENDCVHLNAFSDNDMW